MCSHTLYAMYIVLKDVHCLVDFKDRLLNTKPQPLLVKSLKGII